MQGEIWQAEAAKDAADTKNGKVHYDFSMERRWDFV